jgi:hypothetical protein
MSELLSFTYWDAISDRLHGSHPWRPPRYSIMSNVLTSVLSPEAPVFERSIGVQSFLIESQRRVIEHCTRLLKAQDLAAEHRQRLTRLVELTEAELQRLHA